MANHAFLNQKGIIEVSLEGDQTGESILQSVKDAKIHADTLKSRGRPIILLFDFGKLGKMNVEARRQAVKSLDLIDYHKMAGINANFITAFITNSVARVNGNLYRNRHFKNRQQAEKWLFED